MILIASLPFCLFFRRCYGTGISIAVSVIISVVVSIVSGIVVVITGLIGISGILIIFGILAVLRIGILFVLIVIILVILFFLIVAGAALRRTGSFCEIFRVGRTTADRQKTSDRTYCFSALQMQAW